MRIEKPRGDRSCWKEEIIQAIPTFDTSYISLQLPSGPARRKRTLLPLLRPSFENESWIEKTHKIYSKFLHDWTNLSINSEASGMLVLLNALTRVFWEKHGGELVRRIWICYTEWVQDNKISLKNAIMLCDPFKHSLQATRPSPQKL